MKKTFLFLLLNFLCYQVIAQKSVFIRMYDANVRLLTKGYVLKATDTSLQLKLSKRDTIIIPMAKIGIIKTKHSAGHSILIGAAAGAIPFGIIGYASGDHRVNDNTLGGAFHDLFIITPAEGLVMGFLVGGGAGAAVSALTTLIKKPKTFIINGNQERWKEFKSSIIPLEQMK